MINDKDISKALRLLGLGDDYIVRHPAGFDGISIDRLNSAGCLDDRAYYFDNVDDFNDFIYDIIN